MKVSLESTTKIVELNGIQCRVWEGETEKGVKCHAFIPLIACHKRDDCSQFREELEEKASPSRAVLDAHYPDRLHLLREGVPIE